MSVRKNERNVSGIQFLFDVNQMCVTIKRYVTKEKVLPKKSRNLFALRLLDLSESVRDDVIEANSIYPLNKDNTINQTKLRDRYELQKQALTNIRRIFNMIDDLVAAEITNPDAIQYLLISLKNAERSIYGWYKNDVKRFGELLDEEP